MNRALMLCALSLFVSLPCRAGGGDGPKPLEPRAFFESLRGDYAIERVGGAQPTGGDFTAFVDVEGDQAVLNLPYCKPVVCDPGYVFIPFAQAQVIGDGVKNDISVTKDGKVSKFTWEVTGATVVFRNYQYHRDGGWQLVMEHVLRKLAYQR